MIRLKLNKLLNTFIKKSPAMPGFFMFRMNGMPRAQDAQERRVSISHGTNEWINNLKRATHLVDDQGTDITHGSHIGPGKNRPAPAIGFPADGRKSGGTL